MAVPHRSRRAQLPYAAPAFGIKVAIMQLTSSRRSLTAWALYFCVLFNVIACGLGHGQMMGLELNGVDGSFCSALGNKGPISDLGSRDNSASDWSSAFSCPICSAITLSFALLFCLTWLLSASKRAGFYRYIRCRAPPRYYWPSANPRASPQF